ncbi:hypothetical protein P7K49_028793, partial [Saguinus oedipus]
MEESTAIQKNVMVTVRKPQWQPCPKTYRLPHQNLPAVGELSVTTDLGHSEPGRGNTASECVRLPKQSSLSPAPRKPSMGYSDKDWGLPTRAMCLARTLKEMA